MTCPLYRFTKLTISLILFPVLKQFLEHLEDNAEAEDEEEDEPFNYGQQGEGKQRPPGPGQKNGAVNQESEEIFKNIENAKDTSEQTEDKIVENGEEQKS